MTTIQKDIFNGIANERHRQVTKWGVQSHCDMKWLTILAEEFGEIAKAILEEKPAEMNEEIEHTAAVCVAWLEHVSRKNQR